MRNSIFYIVLASLLLAGCRHDEPVLPPEEEKHGDTLRTSVVGMYLLNEGNMGSNKSTLDYYDYQTATYRRNIYAEANPTVAKELGDVGNDLQIYGSRLYAVINCSNKVEVMDARTCKRIGQVDIPNCRYITFQGQYAYVTSYAGPVSVDASHAQIGYVARIDTATLQIIDQCLVGYQPDGLAIVGNKMYVANSGGYMVPNYENTLSVIDLTTFTETARIPVAINLHQVRKDSHDRLWVTSRGDYFNTPSRLYCVDTSTDQVIDSVMVPVSDIDIVGDSLYLCATEWSYVTMRDSVTYGIVDVVTRRMVNDHFVTDGTAADITKPYCIKVHPITRDVYITDAKNYVTPGMLHCYSPQGQLQWSVRTGDIPAHIAFLYLFTN